MKLVSFLIPGLTKHIVIIPMTAATTADINIDEYPYDVTSIPVNVGAIIVAELTKKCVIPPYVQFLRCCINNDRPINSIWQEYTGIT